MTEHHAPHPLVNFPCHYEYKVFATATADDTFADTVRQAVARVVPGRVVAVRTRLSSGGRYQCVTARVYLENSTQLTDIYANLRTIAGLRYLL